MKLTAGFGKIESVVDSISRIFAGPSLEDSGVVDCGV